MSLLIGLAAIAALGGLYLWRARTRPGRAHLYDPPHTPPTVEWANPRRDQNPER